MSLPIFFSESLYPYSWEFQEDKSLVSIYGSMQTATIAETKGSVNNKDLLIHNVIGEATGHFLMTIQ